MHAVLRELRPTLALAFPIVVGQVSQMLMGITDSVMIGRVGKVPLAASAFSHSLWIVVFIIGIGLLTSVSVLVARSTMGEEAVYPLAKHDANGELLDGSKHKYTLTFPPEGFPPVNAFWSVTMYDGKTQLLIENPINRYLINSPMLPDLKKGPDGSLTLYIQKDSPGPERESNWLPAPDGPIYLVMRLYWPKTEAPSVLPPGEGSWKPPAIAVAK